MLHYLIFAIQWFISVLKRLTLFVPEWFESAGLVMHIGFWSDFHNQS